MSRDGVIFFPAVQQLAMLSSRKISSLELAEEHIRQIHRLNGKLNAIVDFDADDLRQQARQADQTATFGRPLHGLPMTVKASIAVSGRRCETGSLLNRGFRPSEDAVIVKRMRRAGALIIGTTNCPEFLMAYLTDNRLYGRTSNPWDLTRTAGGSSGGESAAIAAGLSAGGFGSDGGGSVREPAHFTGICALKPTSGRIPTLGHLPACLGPFGILGAIGPMARTIADVKFFFEVLSGQYVADQVSVPIASDRYSDSDLKSIRIGYFEDDGLVPVSGVSRESVREVVRWLRSRGFKVQPFRPIVLEEVRQLWWKMFVRCGAMLFAPLIKGKDEELSRLFVEFLEIAGREPVLSGDEMLQAWTDCDRLRAALLEEMRDYPVLISPVCSVSAFHHDERSWLIDGKCVDYLDAMRYTQWSNVLAGPAAVIPILRSPEGMPVGIQVAGRPHEDELVMAVAASIEREFGYVPPPLDWAIDR